MRRTTYLPLLPHIATFSPGDMERVIFLIARWFVLVSLRLSLKPLEASLSSLPGKFSYYTRFHGATLTHMTPTRYQSQYSLAVAIHGEE